MMSGLFQRLELVMRTLPPEHKNKKRVSQAQRRFKAVNIDLLAGIPRKLPEERGNELREKLSPLYKVSN